MRFIPVGLRNYLASRLLFDVARHMVQVFVPLLLWGHNLGLWHIFAFYAMASAMSSVMCFVAIRFTSRRGERFALAIGSIAIVLYQVLLGLYVGGAGDWIIYLMPVALATSEMFVVVANSVHVAQAMDPKRPGRDMAFVRTLVQVGSAVGPFIGAFIAVHAGVSWLIVTAVTLMACSLVPVWRMEQGIAVAANPGTPRFQPLPPRRDLMAGICFQWSASIGMLVWPVYLAVIVPGFAAIGTIMTVGLLLGLGLVAVVGWLVDRRRHHFTVRVLVALIALTHLSRLLGHGAYWLAIVTALFAALFTCFCVPWYSSYYHHVRSEGIGYILAMEAVAAMGNSVLWSTLALLSYIGFSSGAIFATAFVVGAGAVWGCLLLRRA